MGFAASSIVAAAVGVASMDDAAAQQQTAFGENVSVDPATLRRLAADIAGADPDDIGSVDVERRRARALRILARVTLFLDHHDAIVAVPEVADALIQCLERGAVVAIDDDEDERHDTVGSASTADAIRASRTWRRNRRCARRSARRPAPSSRSPPRWTSPDGNRGGGPRRKGVVVVVVVVGVHSWRSCSERRRRPRLDSPRSSRATRPRTPPSSARTCPPPSSARVHAFAAARWARSGVGSAP